MPEPTPIQRPLVERLILALQDRLQAPIIGNDDLEAARALIAATAFRRRDEDTVITPETDTIKGPRLVVSVRDNGRYKLGTPIRMLRLEIEIRVNAKVAAGKRDPFLTLCAAMETFIDGLNLRDALSSEDRAIAVMLATRAPGTGHGASSDLRIESYALDIRAVGTEHTASE